MGISRRPQSLVKFILSLWWKYFGRDLPCTRAINLLTDPQFFGSGRKKYHSVLFWSRVFAPYNIQDLLEYETIATNKILPVGALLVHNDSFGEVGTFQ
jgi:hypothetical protein